MNLCAANRLNSVLRVVILLVPLISPTLAEYAAYNIRELERLRQAISLPIDTKGYVLEEPGTSAIGALVENKGKKIPIAAMKKALLTEIAKDATATRMEAYMSLNRILANERDAQSIGLLYATYLRVKRSIQDLILDEPVAVSTYMRLIILIGQVIEYMARVNEKPKYVEMTKLERGFRETTADMLKKKKTERAHDCATKLIETVINSLQKRGVANFSLIKCLMDKHTARPVGLILDRLFEAKSIDSTTSFTDTDTARRWFNISSLMPPGYALEVDHIYGSFRARFSRSVLERQTEPVYAIPRIQKSLKTFAECSECRAGCVLDKHTLVFRPTKPGHFSVGSASGCLEAQCPIKADLIYVRGGLESADDCVNQGAVCISAAKILRDGRCTELEPGYVSEQSSDNVYECHNRDVLDRWNRFFTKSTFELGTCNIRLEEPGMHIKFWDSAEKVVKTGQFTLDFEVTLIAEDWGVHAVGSSRIFGVPDKWKFELAKSSTQGQGYLIFTIGPDRLLSHEVQLIELGDGKWKGQFRWVNFNSYSYLITTARKIILRARHASFQWLGDAEKFMLGPETLKNKWDYEVAVNALLDRPDLKGVMKTFASGPGFHLAKLARSDLYEDVGDRQWAKKGVCRILVRDALPILLEQPSRGWPGLGTAEDDWPRHVSHKNSFFFGKQNVNVTELQELLGGPIPRFPVDHEIFDSVVDTIHEAAAVIDESMAAHIDEVKSAVERLEEDSDNPVFEADLAVADDYDADMNDWTADDMPFYFSPLFLKVVGSFIALCILLSLCSCCCCTLRCCFCRKAIYRSHSFLFDQNKQNLDVLAAYARQAIEDLAFHMDSQPIRRALVLGSNSSPV